MSLRHAGGEALAAPGSESLPIQAGLVGYPDRRVERSAPSRNNDTPRDPIGGHRRALSQVGTAERVRIEMIEEVLDGEIHAKMLPDDRAAQVE